MAEETRYDGWWIAGLIAFILWYGTADKPAVNPSCPDGKCPIIVPQPTPTPAPPSPVPTPKPPPRP